MTNTQDDELKKKLKDVIRLYIGQLPQLLDNYDDLLADALIDMIKQRELEARMAENELWHREWGHGTERIGDGSWESYFEYRMSELLSQQEEVSHE